MNENSNSSKSSLKLHSSAPSRPPVIYLLMIPSLSIHNDPNETSPSTNNHQSLLNKSNKKANPLSPLGTRFYKALAGDNCNVIAGKFRTFTVSQFQSWNPAVGSTCSALLKDYFYCIAIPGTPTTPIAGSANPVNNGPQPQQPGTVSYCKKFYQVEPGDSCSGIEQRFGISAADFNVCMLDFFMNFFFVS